MIVIDGRESSLSLANYANLEEVLSKLVEEEGLEQRLVTDVLVDDEAFSELYPHQAEDITSDSFSRLEVRTISLQDMAESVVEELPKVVSIMARGSSHSASLLRENTLLEGFEALQDTLSLSRDLLNTISVLRNLYGSMKDSALDRLGDELGSLLGEMAEAMGNEDWILVADLLEYEYLPACEGWRDIIATVAADIKAARAV